jgi:hypothetical protein
VDEAEGTIAMGSNITFITRVVLRSVGRSFFTIGLSRPRLDIDSFLDDIANG